jgi:hypothetical protein
MHLTRKKPTQADFLFRTRVVECRFNGMISEYAVTTGDTVFKVAMLNRFESEKPALPGETAWLSFSKNSLQILEQ